MTADPPSAFATIREVHAVEATLLRELRAMEERLTAKIEAANVHHEGTHDLMRRTADERHQVIDDFIEGQLMAAKLREGAALGRSGLIGQTYTVLRVVNEFRWLIAIAIAALVAATSGLHLDWNTH
jgi:hypothetical protein